MKGWKIFLFNIGAAIFPVLQAGGVDLGLSPHGMAIYGIATAAVNIALRFFTSTPIFQAK